jgi:hypothetical protein
MRGVGLKIKKKKKKKKERLWSLRDFKIKTCCKKFGRVYRTSYITYILTETDKKFCSFTVFHTSYPYQENTPPPPGKGANISQYHMEEKYEKWTRKKGERKTKRKRRKGERTMGIKKVK